VQIGGQQYVFRGSISWPSGTYQATGSGVIDVVDRHTYFVRWLNTATGICDVTLIE
jgi:hypothetical protein